MRSLKMLALAALAALTAMAFAGASSAMAESTALCKSDESSCKSGNVITHVHETSVGKAKLLSEFSTIECDVLFLGDALGGTASIFSGKLTYSSCNNSCTVMEENEKSEEGEAQSVVVFLKTGTELAAVGGASEVHVKCFFGLLNCTYMMETLGHGLGALTSSSANGSTVISKQELGTVSGSCPPETFLDLTTTPLIKTYITKGGPTMVCVDVGRRRGFFLNFGNGTQCTDEDLFRLGRYELGYTTAP